jgi:hypothetical protein
VYFVCCFHSSPLCKASARTSPHFARDTELEVNTKETDNQKIANFVKAPPNVEKNQLRTL